MPGAEKGGYFYFSVAEAVLKWKEDIDCLPLFYCTVYHYAGQVCLSLNSQTACCDHHLPMGETHAEVEVRPCL